MKTIVWTNQCIIMMILHLKNSDKNISMYPFSLFSVVNKLWHNCCISLAWESYQKKKNVNSTYAIISISFIL